MIEAFLLREKLEKEIEILNDKLDLIAEALSYPDYIGFSKDQYNRYKETDKKRYEKRTYIGPM